MGNPRRTPPDSGLANLLAEQLNALSAEWAPADRHFVGISNTVPPDEADTREEPIAADESDLEDAIRDDEVVVDDVPALIMRSFDHEAALWLLHCAAAPAGPMTH